MMTGLLSVNLFTFYKPKLTKNKSYIIYYNFRSRNYNVDKMSILTNILRDVLSGTSNSCCLCFNAIEDENSIYINDEVSSSIDIETTEELYEMVYTVLGEKVLHAISTHGIICQKCTGMVINCYKFIQQCHKNIEMLKSTIDSLQECTQERVESYDYKAIFVALDDKNYNVEFYYDKHRNSHSQTGLHKRFQRLYNDSHHLIVDYKQESNNTADDINTLVHKRKQSRILQNIELLDIVHDKDELDNNLKCKICLKVYPSIMKIKQHYVRMHAPKDFKCSKCPRSFGSPKLLRQHTKDSHCNVVCSQCGKTYTNMYSLRQHERGHRMVRLICQTCGKVYKGKQAFNNHIEQNLCKKMRKSNAEAKFCCDYCGKKYAQKTALSVHIRLEHENGKALICGWCGKKLSSTSRLKDHILKHTKQKNFECAYCGGKFVSKMSLLYHTRTHTGEKPYKCEFCDKSFLSASRRSQHVKRQHTQSNLECDICHRKFNDNTCLSRHRKKHFDVGSRLYTGRQK